MVPLKIWFPGLQVHVHVSPQLLSLFIGTLPTYTMKLYVVSFYPVAAIPFEFFVVSHVHIHAYMYMQGYMCIYVYTLYIISESGHEDNEEEGEEVNPAMNAGNFSSYNACTCVVSSPYPPMHTDKRGSRISWLLPSHYTHPN